MAGVVAALVADDERRLLGEEVGGLALALVAPLEPDDHGGRHQAAPDTVRPRSGPGSSGIHVSRVRPPFVRRTGVPKVGARLTGRTPRLPRATASPPCRAPGGPASEDGASIAGQNADQRRERSPARSARALAAR